MPAWRRPSGKMPGMKILAIETSTDYGSCALWQDGVIDQRICPPGRPHSETLLPLVRALLADSGLVLAQLDAIAFGAGPGAFTGLRVACGVAQGLAAGADLSVVPVCGLEAMAETVGEPLVLSLLDARMGEVYSATCTVSGEGDRKAGELSVGPPATLAVPVSGNWIACGNALAAYPELAERLRNAGFALRPEIVPEAAAVARLAACRLKEGAGIDPALAAPLYIRDKVARTTRERLEAGGRA
jgi:tRNA threonylcarbamoyladenosine biosynthesis protein TsaB